MKLQPVFVDKLPEFNAIKEGELWISHKHRTINLRCPCGCGNLTVLSLHPSRWHVHYDGHSVSLEGPTGGSIWASSGCGSHYFIRNSEVCWSYSINPRLKRSYEDVERNRMVESVPSRRTFMTRLLDKWRSMVDGKSKK